MKKRTRGWRILISIFVLAFIAETWSLYIHAMVKRDLSSSIGTGCVLLGIVFFIYRLYRFRELERKLDDVKFGLEIESLSLQNLKTRLNRMIAAYGAAMDVLHRQDGSIGGDAGSGAVEQTRPTGVDEGRSDSPILPSDSGEDSGLYGTDWGRF